MGAAPRIELLWWQGCPSTERALEILREEVSGLGLEPDAIELTEVRTDADAERTEFVGSPTVRVNGRDVQAPDGDPVGLTCRVYRLRDGRISPLPDREDLREALARAVEEEGN
jgi:hypothetical protein